MGKIAALSTEVLRKRANNPGKISKLRDIHLQFDLGPLMVSAHRHESLCNDDRNVFMLSVSHVASLFQFFPCSTCFEEHWKRGAPRVRCMGPASASGRHVAFYSYEYNLLFAECCWLRLLRNRERFLHIATDHLARPVPTRSLCKEAKWLRPQIFQRRRTEHGKLYRRRSAAFVSSRQEGLKSTQYLEHLSFAAGKSIIAHKKFVPMKVESGISTSSSVARVTIDLHVKMRDLPRIEHPRQF